MAHETLKCSSKGREEEERELVNLGVNSVSLLMFCKEVNVQLGLYPDQYGLPNFFVMWFLLYLISRYFYVLINAQ